MKNTAVCLLIYFLMVAPGMTSEAQILINEIMYAPPSGAAEWVELFNAGTETVDVAAYILHDATAARACIAEQALPLAPGGYLVVAGDASVRAEFPGSYLFVVMRDFPALNNGGDDVVLLAPDSTVADYVQYRSSWGGAGGRSLERMSRTGVSNSASQWASCIDPLRATPGARNSVALPDYDIALARFDAAPPESSPVSDIVVKVRVRNAGSYPADVFEVRIFEDADADHAPDTRWPVRTLHAAAPLLPGDSCLLEGYIAPNETAGQSLVAVAVFSADQRAGNDTLHTAIFWLLDRHALVVNEVMYAPMEGESEWIELCNRSGRSIGIDGLTVQGRSGSGAVTTAGLYAPGCVLAPGDLIVLASDSNVMTQCGGAHDTHPAPIRVILTSAALELGNDGEDIVILDRAGSVLDSVWYHPGLHNPNVFDTRGRSLERLHPDFPSADAWAWSTSAHVCGGTPGRRNSLYTDVPPWIEQPGSRCIPAPNPFSPDGDGREDHCLIRYELPAAVAQIRVRIYDALGRYVRTIQSNEHSGRSGELLFDGRDDNRAPLPVGQYIILLESVDAHRADVSVLKTVVVIAAPL